jgi:cobalamin biosynthesis Co2+ chelatase CbiK
LGCGGREMINTYTIYDNGVLLATKLTSLQIQKLTGINRSMLSHVVTEKKTYKKRYRIEIDREILQWADDFHKKWDNVRFKLNPKARDYQ